MHEFDYTNLEKATGNFSPSRLIGKGSHGYVYRGTAVDDGGDRRIVVAVKKQSLGLQKLGDNSKLENEAGVLSSLPEKSPHLVNLLGTSRDPAGNRVLVMEHMPKGTLHELLHSGAAPPSWPKRAQVALQVAKSVRFLHELFPPVIHRDIKSANVLFDGGRNARLSDLGLAIRMSYSSLTRRTDSLNRPAGTIGYLDPSYTVPSQLSTKIDVFSFGVLLLEIISGEKVIDVSRSPSSIVDWAVPLIQENRAIEICDRRVPISRLFEGMVQSMVYVAKRCVNDGEFDRPSMSEVVAELEKCAVELPLRNRPPWVKYLKGLIHGKKKAANNKSVAKAATSKIVCVARDDQRTVSRGKLLVREILADIS